MRAILLILFAALPLGAMEIAFSDAIPGPAASRQFAAAIASNGSEYLVVWSDQRTGAIETWASRVSADGEVLDPTGIRLGAETTCERAVVWTGSEWLVVWSTGDGRLWESRVSADGEVRHHGRLLAEGVQSPNVVQAGTHTVVAYSRAADPFDPHALFIDGGGHVVADFALASGGHPRQAPQLAWNGDTIVAVWTAGPRPGDTVIEGVRFTVSGLIDVSPKTLVSDGAPLGPLIASNGTDYLLVTRDHATRNDSAHRVGASLSDVGEASLLASGGSGRTMLQATDSGYVVIAEDGFSIVGFRLDDDGAMVGAEVATLQTLGGIAAAATPVVAANDDSLFLAWTGTTNDATNGATGGDFDIYGGTISQSLTPVETRLLSASAARQENPLVVAGGPTLLTLWSEGSALFARRIEADGAPFDESPVQLTASASSASASFDGTEYVVAWRDRASSLLTTMRIPLVDPIETEGQWRLDAATPVALASASDGGATLVGWVSEGMLQVARVDEEGRIRDESALRVGSGGIDTLAISGSDGNGFLVVWGETASREDGTVTPTTVRGAIVSADLTLLSFPGFEIADTEAAEGDPVVGWVEREWLVGWQRTTPTRSELRARHIALSGWPVEGTARDAGVLVAENASSPQIAWDGSRYHFAWIERSDATAAPRLRLASSASVRAQPGDVADAGAAAGGRAQFAVMGAGRVATAYSRIALDAIYGGVARAFVSLPELQGRRRTVR